MLEQTEPMIYYYDNNTNFIYIMDDYGTAIKVPTYNWYDPPAHRFSGEH